jgi:hypothetical protein
VFCLENSCGGDTEIASFVKNENERMPQRQNTVTAMDSSRRMSLRVNERICVRAQTNLRARSEKIKLLEE